MRLPCATPAKQLPATKVAPVWTPAEVAITQKAEAISLSFLRYGLPNSSEPRSRNTKASD
jgi:hypothetical protein